MPRKKNTPEILFARHGQSEANADKYLAGQMDVGLTSQGEIQAATTGRRLRDGVLCLI